MRIDRNGILYLRRRGFAQWLTLWLVVCPFLPDVLKYTADAAWVALGVVLVLERRLENRRDLRPFALWIGAVFAVAVLGSLLQYQSVFYTLWGIRNRFRYDVAFLAFCVYLNREDAKGLLRFLDGLFWANAVVSVVQFALLGYRQDHLGGIFGVERGCNSNTLLFFSVVLSRSVLRFLTGEEKPRDCFAKCAAAMGIAAMAELKFFFVVFLLILVMAGLVTPPSRRKAAVFAAAGVMMAVSGWILTAVFGDGSRMTIQRIWELATSPHYATGEDLGRFTAISTLSRTVLTDLPGRLFGLGLGNCDTSAFSICQTPFYRQYSHLHYTWFSSAFLFLETGYAGLLGYLGFFVLAFAKARKKRDEAPLFCRMAMIQAVVCVILTFYNASLRMDLAYLVYFVLALPLLDGERG